MNFSKLCTPAFIYFVLGVISIIMLSVKGFLLYPIIVKAVFVLLWTWFLNFLCSKGFGIISWILVLLPFLVLLGIFSAL